MTFLSLALVRVIVNVDKKRRKGCCVSLSTRLNLSLAPLLEYRDMLPKVSASRTNVGGGMWITFSGTYAQAVQLP